MSFGVGQSAISSVKSNLSLRSKRSRLKNTLFVTKTKKLEFKGDDIISQKLLQLRRGLKRENKKGLLYQRIVGALIMLTLACVISYFIL